MAKQFGAAAVMRAALLVTGSTYVAYATGLIGSTLIARTLGPADYGRYAYLVWLSGIVVLFMNNGLTTSSIRFVSETMGRGDNNTAKGLHHWFWVRQWWSVLAASVLFVLALPFLRPVGWESKLLLVAGIVTLASIPKAWYLFGVSMAKGYGRFGVEATTLTAMSISNTLGVIVLMWLDADLLAFLGLFVLTSLAHPLLLSRVRGKPVRDSAQRAVAPDTLARLKPHYYWTSLLSAASVFYGTSMCMLFLNHYTDAKAVGYFSVAVALTRGGVELLASGLNTVLMPLLAHGFGQGGRERTSRISADAVRMFHFFGLLLTGIGLLWAYPVVLTMYGDQFADAALAFQVLIVAGGLTLPASVLATLMSTTDQQRPRVLMVAASLALIAALCWWLVPLHGLKGALVAHAVMSLVTYAAFFYVTVRNGSLQVPGAALTRLTVAAVLAGGLASAPLLWSDGLWMQFAAGALFIVLFPLATLLLRAWQTSDLALVAQQAQRFGPLGEVLRGIERWGAAQTAP